MNLISLILFSSIPGSAYFLRNKAPWKTTLNLALNTTAVWFIYGESINHSTWIGCWKLGLILLTGTISSAFAATHIHQKDQNQKDQKTRNNTASRVLATPTLIAAFAFQTAVLAGIHFLIHCERRPEGHQAEHYYWLEPPATPCFQTKI